jgi:hypothetical protein
MMILFFKVEYRNDVPIYNSRINIPNVVRLFMSNKWWDCSMCSSFSSAELFGKFRANTPISPGNSGDVWT